MTGELETRPGGRDIRILLAHRPDVATQLATPSRVDLVVAGHTHGGRVQLPLSGRLHRVSSEAGRRSCGSELRPRWK